MIKREIIGPFEMPEGMKAAINSLAWSLDRDGYGFFASFDFEDGKPTTGIIGNGHERPVRIVHQGGEWLEYTKSEVVDA